MEPDWAYLPATALNLILANLVEQVDHIWFGAVCKNWWSVAKHYHQSCEPGSKVLPMLMIPTKRKSRKKRSLYGISAKKVYPFQLPLPYSRRCCGSSYGWIATVDRCNVITLFNPFKNVAPISLPPIDRGNVWDDTFYERNIHKVTLSADPGTNRDDYVVATVHNQCCHLAFIKAGQKFWTYVDNGLKCFNDITFHKGLVYAVGRWEGIVSFDLRYSNDPSGSEMIVPNILSPQIFGGSYSQRAYLVKSLEGELWMVRRFLGFRPEEDYQYSSGTKSFKVYKLEVDAQGGKLLNKLELKSLGDNVLFVGDNDSISVSASHFSSCLQKDSIYYTDDFNDEPIPYHSGPFDMGFYNIKDENFGQHYPYNPSFKRMPPPLWVLPRL